MILRPLVSRSRIRPLWLVILAATLSLLIGSSGPALASQRTPSPPREISVMTQNLYLGTNLQPLFGLQGEDLILAAADAYDEVVQNDFPARAEAIAREIAADSPALVSLQEVALWQTGPD